MKKAFAVIILLALVLTGCNSHNQADPTDMEAFQFDPHPTLFEEVTEVTEGLDDQKIEDKLISTETDATSGKDNPTETTDPVEKSTDPSTFQPTPTTPQGNDEQSQTKPPQETGTAPTTPAPADPIPPTQTDTVPPESEFKNPETEPTEPETTPTAPPTEPAGRSHDWKCIRHAEEGHWRAGIICDCGWVIYGSPDEISAAWNAHSASFPPEESLFEHGGFGCVDEWVVDASAYEEWYCSLCGEAKP